ncbi:RluA Pseudouridine Synthase [Pleurotus pulmonarius]|nr:hypothetical protein EYR38_010413 [Pleurotus pulmonarius]
MSLRSSSGALRHVAYIDRGIVLLNKPAGLVCQAQLPRNASLESETNENKFDYLLQGLKNSLNLPDGLFPVHRLDKCTTGSLLLARSASMARDLSRQFSQRTIDKYYLAIVRGGRASFPGGEGTVEAALQYNEGRGSLDSSTKTSNSVTSWKLLATSPVAPLSLIQLKLHTGLKHQLRIHMAQCLRAPILGDALYSSTTSSKSVGKNISLPKDRVLLHSSFLEFDRFRKSGPNKHLRLGLRSPLPSDFLKLCSDLSIRIDPEYARGGIYVDGHRIDGPLLTDLDGRWL